MMKVKVHWVYVLFVGLALLVSACAPAMISEDASYDMPASEPAYDGYMEESIMTEGAVEAERGFVSGTGDVKAVIDRMVIYNAEMEIAVKNPEETMKSVIQMAEDAGGFVVRSNLSRTQYNGGSLPRATLTVRVPAGQLNSIMNAIKELTPVPGEDVLYENVSGQDVTAEYTDLESRLRNLEAAEGALVELMEDAQNPEDVLNIFDELTYYRGEIEIVKGRMRYLEESAALSAISLTIVPKESLRPIEIAGWRPMGTVKDAVEALINTGQFLVDAAIWFGLFCLPFLIPLGFGVYFLVRIIRKRKAKKKAQKSETSEPSAETEG